VALAVDSVGAAEGDPDDGELPVEGATTTVAGWSGAAVAVRRK
jgi:hypothetical protein